MNALIWQLYDHMMSSQQEKLLACNEKTRDFGLVLSDVDANMLAAARVESLQHTGRIEFGEGIAARLILAFADSPYLTQETYADTIAALLSLFDTFKNEMGDAYNDRELLTFMRDAFDGECGGSLEILETEVFARLLTGAGTARTPFETLEQTRECIRCMYGKQCACADFSLYRHI